jgi:hypothetical protein
MEKLIFFSQIDPDSPLWGSDFWDNWGLGKAYYLLISSLFFRSLLFCQRNLIGLAMERNTRQQEQVQLEIQMINVPDDTCQAIKNVCLSRKLQL